MGPREREGFRGGVRLYLFGGQTRREFLAEHHHGLDVQVARRGPVQEQFALGREAFLRHFIIEKEKGGIVGKKKEREGGVVTPLCVRFYASRFLAGGLEAVFALCLMSSMFYEEVMD